MCRRLLYLCPPKASPALGCVCGPARQNRVRCPFAVHSWAMYLARTDTMSAVHLWQPVGVSLSHDATGQNITTRWISMLGQMEQAMQKLKEHVNCQVRREMRILYDDSQFQSSSFSKDPAHNKRFCQKQ
jgi:hypothetical protein